MPKLAMGHWPKILLESKRNSVVKGIFVGGCVARGDGSSFRAFAHAHSNAQDGHVGWICVRAAKRLEDDALMIHELAHLSLGEGKHGDAWRREVLALGGTLDAVPGGLRSYKKAERQVVRPRRLSAICGQCPRCGRDVREKSAWYRGDTKGPLHLKCAIAICEEKQAEEAIELEERRYA